jgi:hypothetical protein
MSSEPLLRFPVVCPICKEKMLFQTALAPVLQALLTMRDIRLNTSCCGKVDWLSRPQSKPSKLNNTQVVSLVEQHKVR